MTCHRDRGFKLDVREETQAMVQEEKKVGIGGGNSAELSRETIRLLICEIYMSDYTKG